jgi:hypothetical protein
MRPLRLILVPVLGSFWAASSAAAGEPIDYSRQVKPLLAERCLACHGGLAQKAGLRLDTAVLARQGGDNGPVVSAGNSAASVLIERVSSTDPSIRMPPPGEGAPLSTDEVALLSAWIDAGAIGPPDEQPEKDPRAHWAFVRPTRPGVPTTPAAVGARNPIDSFIYATHEAHGLSASPSAVRETLLRRVHLDLTGLPPSRQELHAFLADDSPSAYEHVVERLLASPHYGERWGRHWMDVWRYCDWYGNAGSGSWWNSGCEIWRWRDWIVRSLNDDLGYDQMVQQMLAADELTPTDDQAIVATGYIVRNWYALNYNAWKRDLVEHTGKAFLGLTFNCCHCHDHKYDPISQREYFRFRAFFEPLELRLDRVPGTPDPGRFVPYGAATGGPESMPVQGGMIRIVDAFPDAPTRIYRGGDERDIVADQSPITAAAPAFLHGDALPIAPVSLPVEAWYPALKQTVIDEDLRKAAAAISDAQRAQRAAGDKLALILADAELAAAEARAQSLQARIAAERVKHLAELGDWSALARTASRLERTAAVATAEARLLAANQALGAAQGARQEATVSKAQADVQAAQSALDQARQAAIGENDQYSLLGPQYVTSSTGRRSALARWITSQDNPLTARVAVNHIWIRHFGRPLVESVYNFGRNGKRPSHPELLDWLAVEFMDSGWSMKHMHRLMVTSNVYRQGATCSDPAMSANLAIDPDNQFLWRIQPRRVEAEVVRDSILSAAGALDRTLGGADLPVAQELESRRRALYFNVRPIGFDGQKVLAAFDAPNPGECYRRSESIVPQQALALSNSPLVQHHGRLLARRLWDSLIDETAATPSDAEFILAAYEQILGRRPTAAEREACAEFLRQQVALYYSVGPTALPTAAAAGVVSASTDPAARAREGLVRALLNHTEFVTVP